jgi:hypothetical protein
MRRPQRPQISTPESRALPARAGPSTSSGAVRGHVGLYLGAVALILLPADIGRHTVGQKYLRHLHTGGTTARARPPRPLTPPIRQPQAVNIGAGIDRIGEQIVQCRAIGAVPPEPVEGPVRPCRDRCSRVPTAVRHARPGNASPCRPCAVARTARTPAGSSPAPPEPVEGSSGSNTISPEGRRT